MIRILNDDIFKQDVDAIVNPANTQMLHLGGLAGLIAGLGGEEVIEASRELAPVATGSAISTSAGNLLPFKRIIHAVGPVWGGGKYHEDELLYQAHISALDLAVKEDVHSIAFPAISCGVFGYPVTEAAISALSAMMDYRLGIDDPYRYLPEDDRLDVRFCLVDAGHHEAFIAAAKELEIAYTTKVGK